MKLHAKDILRPTAVLFLICVIVAAALAGTNLLTKDKIAEQAAEKAEKSRKLALSAADTFTPVDGYDCYVGTSGNEIVGYVFETSAKGYGGDVDVMTGISLEGKITGVILLDHEETPGLGANAEKEEFRAQFLQDVPETLLKLVKYQAPQPGEVEAMTGASMTSRAVMNAVNEAIQQYHSILKGGA